jgi:mannosylglycoprotein endo-beta-mannosidase
MDCVKSAWEQQSKKKYSSAIIADKFKVLRQGLKRWHVSLSKLKIVIQNCNKVIFILDSLEEKRLLFISEFNFRKIVKLHLEKLLLIECNYWRKRCTMRWVKVGEDNTKFFHAMATQRFRRNSGMLWASYKERMGS